MKQMPALVATGSGRALILVEVCTEASFIPRSLRAEPGYGG